ncbi:CNH domain-containing protein [Sporodiniella umbellata]|nr:CNH domain-containing protein [Sporodiniella umbellata]
MDSADELYVFRYKKDYDLSAEEESDNTEMPNGVFTPFTSCYSPTCKDESPCYSFGCPKRKGLKRSHSISSLQEKDESSLWIHSVPTSILEATSPDEVKRQECIFELIYTERDFVRDLQYMDHHWIEPLLTQDIISEENRENFVELVFSNIAEIESINYELSRSLDHRQSESHAVTSVGDIMLQHVCNFEPFVTYGANQLVGKFYFELEKKRNPKFAKFVEETERKPQSRRLELNGYLTKPTTRLGRYNLLLREILKKTPDGNPDKELIPQVMENITQYLTQVNSDTGKMENKFNLEQIQQRLSFKTQAESEALQLQDPNRQLLLKGRMKRKGNASSEAADMQIFLLDNYLVISKVKMIDHLEHYRAVRKAIPLELLSIQASSSNQRQKRTSSILPYSKSPSNSNSPLPKPSMPENSQSKTSRSITFNHHGRRGSPPITLYATSESNQNLWVKTIKNQQEAFAQERHVFSIIPLIRGHFTVSNRVNSTLILDAQQKRILIGTDQGVYVTHKNPETKKLAVTRVIHLDKVSQIEVMPDSQLLVLADKTLWSFPPDVLSPTHGSSSQQQRGRSVSQNTSFFHVGECMSKTLVCVVKTTTLSATTIRVFEPVVMDESKKTKPMFSIRRLVRGGPVGLKAYKDLYLPSEASSINLLTSKMCISSAKEIGVVDMKNFGVQTLLDPEDENLSFVFSRTDIKPVTIYRIEFAKYLVCYNEFAFLVDQRGRFIQSSKIIDWEGTPDSFALSYPYLLAFEPGFIEVRNVNTGNLEQVLRGKNIRCTSNNTQSSIIQCSMNDPEDDGHQIVYHLERAPETDSLALSA